MVVIKLLYPYAVSTYLVNEIYDAVLNIHYLCMFFFLMVLLTFVEYNYNIITVLLQGRS